MGTLDGRHLENRSVPLLKMEVDVIPAVIPCTVGNFPVFATGGILTNSVYNASSFATAGHNHDTWYISIITTPTAGNIPLMTASGELVTSPYVPSNAAGATNIPTNAGQAVLNVGLNADYLDGQHASYFATGTHNHDSQYISIITSPVAGNVPLMTADGELVTSPYSVGNAQNQIPLNNNVLNVGLVAESVNGVNLSGLVTVAGTQTITGAKTFTADVIMNGNLTVNGTTTSIDTANLVIEDAEITLNKNETGAGVTANGGLSGFRVERGTAPDFLAVFDESIDKFRVGTVGSLTSVSLEGHTHGGESLTIPSGIGQTNNFAGAGSSTLVTFSPAAPSVAGYEVIITPKGNPGGNLGEFWYEKVSTTQFRVYNSGTATSGFFYMVLMA